MRCSAQPTSAAAQSPSTPLAQAHTSSSRLVVIAHCHSSTLPQHAAHARSGSQQQPASRYGRSPPTSPRVVAAADTTDPALVRGLRLYLLRAAQRPGVVGTELAELLEAKLGLSAQDVEQLLANTSSPSSPLPSSQQQLQELETGLDQLLQLNFSTEALTKLLQQQPALLSSPLASWCEFFTAYGFSPSQIRNLISQTQGEVLTKGSLVTAGDAIMHLKALGFDNDEIRHRVVAYCPQVLAMSSQDIDVLIRLWSKFKVGVDEAGPTC